MSRLVTQLVADDPAIVLVGENTILSEKMGHVLSQKNILVHKIKPEDLKTSTELLENAYKIIWVYDGDFSDKENYLNIISSLNELSLPVILIAPIFQTIESYSSDLLDMWKTKSEEQLQFIVDCNYHLSKISFIFGQDIIGNSDDKSIISFVSNHIHKNILINPDTNFSFFSIDDFISQVSDLIFIPKKQQSVVIKGKNSNNTQFISLLKKLYDAYHDTNVEVLFDSVSISNPVPFSVKEIVVPVDVRTIATYTVKKLSSPGKNISEEKTPIIPSPTPTEEKKTEEVMKISQVKQPSEIVSEPEVTLKSTSEIIKTQQNRLENEEKIATKQVNAELDVNKEIQRIFKDTRTGKKVERVTKIAKTTTKIKKKSKRKTGLFYGGLLSIGMALGMIVFAIVYFISGNILKEQLIITLEKTSQSESFFSESSIALRKNANFVASQTSVYGQIIELDVIVKNSTLVNLSNQIIEIPTVLTEADKASKNLVIQILSGNIGETTEIAEILTQKAQEAYEKLSLMQVSLQQADLTSNSEKQLDIINSIEEKIKDIRSGLAIQQQIQPILPELFGVEDKKTYALLFQNNQELRPTGGFIQAVALLNFDKGSLVSYKVYSIYELDKKLPGKVVPPEEITKYLGEESWYMRDSNWNPHFPDASRQIAWFIEKSLGVNVDGVIGMNVYSLAEIIKGTGAIELPEHNEVITSKNLEERMEFHSEVVLVDSPESIDYAVKLLREVLASLITLKEDAVPTLLSGLNNSLETKQLQVTSFDDSAQSIFNSLGWSGSLVVPSCPARLSIVDCSVDVMAQVEANVGVNKANYYLKRSIVHDVKVSPVEAQHKRTITFENTAKSNSWPKGTYKSYQRFFIDSEAVLEDILINGSPLVPEQIYSEKVGDFTSLGVSVDVPIQKIVTVELIYSTPLNHSSGGFSYVFYNRKQSGLEDDPFTVVVTHSLDIKPTLVAPSASISDNVITFESDSLDDAALFGVMFD
jgi:hypothetical protein